MEKISDESLFYLRSRGIEKETALAMMIESKVVNLYRGLESHAPELYESLLAEVLV